MEKTRAAVRISLIGDILSAQIRGEIDHHSAKAVREEIDGQIYLHRPKEIVLGLSEVSFMDSSGLGLIVGRLVSAKEIGATVRLTGADRRMRYIFEMAGLERMRGLTIEEASEERNRHS